MPKKQATRVVIMGAAGRDFHNFNMVYRTDPYTEVAAFTAAQIPDIAGRRYPAVLAGPNYPQGIPIVDESGLDQLCKKEHIDQVVFAYSDVPHAHVMHKASVALAAGADFILLGPERTMLQVEVPVIAVCAVRTGCGKSQTTRWLSQRLRAKGLKVVVIRHPMPYGDLAKQAVQRFATIRDLDAADCTIEEREDYRPHLELGNIVYAGVDYGEIVAQAQKEADIILWDGGNNDFPFIHPDLLITLVDPLRPGNETTHHPGETVLRMADVVLVAKVNSAKDEDIQQVIKTAKEINPSAIVTRGASVVTLDDAEAVRNKRVLVIEDGPTITHGGMPWGAGYVAAKETGVKEIIDPRAAASAEIAQVYERYPHIGPVLPAVGYYPSQLQALRETINATDADVVISATTADLAAFIDLNKPVMRAHYEFSEAGEPALGEILESFLRENE
jgi:predicted GTPase